VYNVKGNGNGTEQQKQLETAVKSHNCVKMSKKKAK